MNIRQAKPEDLEEIYHLVKEAFETAEESDGTEHELVCALSKNESFVPELSLVASTDDEQTQIIGYVLFTEIKINKDTAIALGPLAIREDWRGQSIGRTLIEEGHRRAKSLGYPLSVVLGSDEYYSQFGYEEANNFRIVPPFEVESKFFRVYPFTDLGSIEGEVEYAPEFGI
ncbi:GNAT family N-acetyltransferase [Aerococcaceae bacterium WGS1372]